MELGSSPRVPGTLEAARQELERIRFISACAGNVPVEHGLISFAPHDVKQRCHVARNCKNAPVRACCCSLFAESFCTKLSNMLQ